MYLLVNENNIIVGSAHNKPCEISCSKNKQKVFKISNEDYSIDLIGQKLVDFDIVEE